MITKNNNLILTGTGISLQEQFNLHSRSLKNSVVLFFFLTERLSGKNDYLKSMQLLGFRSLKCMSFIANISIC